MRSLAIPLLTAVLLAGCAPKKNLALNTAARTATTTAEMQTALASGADVNQEDDQNKRTPLHEAALNDKPLAARFLINHGAKIEATDEDQRTPLHLAAENGSKDVAAVLIKAGAAIEPLDKHGSTPLFLAAEKGQLEVAHMLLDAGADPKHINADGYTPMMIARVKGMTPVEELLARRASTQPR